MTETLTPHADAPPDAEHWEKSSQLHSRVLQAMIDDPDAFADIPNGCALWIVPDDDPEHAAWVAHTGSAAVLRGQNVYFRWVTVAELPPLPERPVASAPLPGTRRIRYDADGTVLSVTVLGEDGVWRQVTPTPEDAAGLPPVAAGRDGQRGR